MVFNKRRPLSFFTLVIIPEMACVVPPRGTRGLCILIRVTGSVWPLAVSTALSFFSVACTTKALIVSLLSRREIYK